MVICHNQSFQSDCNLRNLLVSTHAIHFFGTPHSGANVTMLQTMTRLVSMYKQATNLMLKDLKTHSSELENIQSLYVAASEKVSSIFFCAEYATSGIGDLGKIVRFFHARTSHSLDYRTSPMPRPRSLVTAIAQPSRFTQPIVTWSDSQLKKRKTIKRFSTISKTTSTVRLM